MLARASSSGDRSAATDAISPRKRVVLAGGGHAHLHCLRHAAAYAGRGHELVLVAPGPLWYSGLATGVLGGMYAADLARIDIAALAARGGATVIHDRVTGLDAAGARIELASGKHLAFDVLSLCLGAAPPPIEGEAGRRDRCFAVKPVERLFDLGAALLKRMAASSVPRVVIAGGGVSAFEVAANILALAAGAQSRADVTVLAGTSALAQLPPAAKRAVMGNLARRGVRIAEGRHVTEVDDSTAATRCGTRYGYDLFVNATGVRASPIASAAGLSTAGPPTGEGGAVLVDPFLRSVTDPRVHAGGDMAAWRDHSLPKAGVYAIREGPVLHRNLLAAVEGRTPVRFRPQARYLWIMNLGDGTGLAVRGPLWWHGRSALWLKDRIDRRFLRQAR